MDNTREKLIELLKLSDACICDLCGEECALDRVAGVIADHLIANGVKIPVMCKDCDIHGKCSVEVLLGNAGFCSSGRRRAGE